MAMYLNSRLSLNLMILGVYTRLTFNQIVLIAISFWIVGHGKTNILVC